MKVLDKAIKEELVMMNIDASSPEEVIQIMADKLFEKGYTKESYKDAVIAREKVFPTGLLLEELNVAIPHCDSEHVLKNAIAIGKLNTGVDFRYIADPNVVVNANLIFMLAIFNPAQQVPVLSTLMNILSSKENVTDIVNAKTSEELVRVLIEKEEG